MERLILLIINKAIGKIIQVKIINIYKIGLSGRIIGFALEIKKPTRNPCCSIVKKMNDR